MIRHFIVSWKAERFRCMWVWIIYCLELAGWLAC
jgi:hypothetical protein